MHTMAILERAKARAGGLVRTISELPPAVTARQVMAAYDAAGGGLLAGGLAYTGLFAVLSSILFIIGLLGFVVRDPVRLATIVGEIGGRVPPLAGLIETGLSRVAESATSFSILGVLGLAWGASRFYGALDDAFARVFHDAPARDLLARIVRGLFLIGLLVAVLVGSLVVAGIGSFVDTYLHPDDSIVLFLAWRATAQLVGVALYVVTIGAIFRWVPPRPPSWAAIRLPAVIVAILLWLLTNAFVLVESRLVGALELFSGFAIVLATMIWLSFGFQLLLLGAAWTYVRDNDAGDVAQSWISAAGEDRTTSS
jgi:membrane protein